MFALWERILAKRANTSTIPSALAIRRQASNNIIVPVLPTPALIWKIFFNFRNFDFSLCYQTCNELQSVTLVEIAKSYSQKPQQIVGKEGLRDQAKQ
jgi:hypothetical protein